MSLTKISLAVHYGNLRKLSLSRPSQGVRIDKNNAFTKLKNNDIEAFLYQFVKARLTLNKNIEALICYSFFQSEIKDKREAEGLRRIICLFGNED